MEVFVLGPLEVRDSGRLIVVRRGKPAALLALLLLRRNELVPSDQLIEALWAGNPPAKAAKALHTYVSELRRALPEGALLTRSPGYVLRVAPGAVDSEQFERLVAAAHVAADAKQWRQARSLLAEALALWRGPAFAEFVYDEFAQAERERLEQLRLAALEDRLDADLALGEGRELVGELEPLVREHPLRERLRAQLMLALYRAGRQADALRVYQEGRSTLVDVLGIEPSAELKEMQRRILTQDPHLLPKDGRKPVATDEAEEPSETRFADGRRVDQGDRRRDRPLRASPRADLGGSTARALRRGLIVGFVAIAVVLAAGVIMTVGLVGDSGTERSLSSTANAVAVIDARTNAVVERIPVGADPARVAFGYGAAWVANAGDRTISRVDARTAKETRIGIAVVPGDIAVGAGAVWVASRSDASLLRIDRRFRDVTDSIPLLSGAPGWGGSAVTVAGGDVWVADNHHFVVLRIDAATKRVAAKTDLHTTGDALAVGFASLWLPSSTPAKVSRLHARTLRGEATIRLAHTPSAIAVGGGGVWVAVRQDDAIWRIDPATNSVRKTIPVGDGPVDVAVGERAVWVANEGDGTVSRIDPRTAEVHEVVRVDGRPVALAAGGGRVWVAVQTRSRTATA